MRMPVLRCSVSVSVKCKKVGCYAHARTSLHLTSINNFTLSNDQTPAILTRHRTLSSFIIIKIRFNSRMFVKQKYDSLSNSWKGGGGVMKNEN